MPAEQDIAEGLSAGEADRLLSLLLRMGRVLRREAQRAGLSSMDTQLLFHLDRTPGIGVSELAALERVASPSMSAHVKRLIAEGWVERMPPAPGEDQRRTGLQLTATGTSTLRDLAQRKREWLISHADAIDPHDRAAIADAIDPLEKLLALLEGAADL